MEGTIVRDILWYLVLLTLIASVAYVAWLLRNEKGNRRIRIFIIAVSSTISSILLGLIASLSWTHTFILMSIFDVVLISGYFFIMEPLTKFLYGSSEKNDEKGHKNVG